MFSSENLPASAGGPIAALREAVHGLRLPTASVYFECNQERISLHQSQVAALDLQLEQVRKRAFAAAVKLMALGGPKHATPDQSAPHIGGIAS